MAKEFQVAEERHLNLFSIEGITADKRLAFSEVNSFSNPLKFIQDALTALKDSIIVQ